MNKNTARIKAGVRALAQQPHEIISGTVVPGSVDMSAYTMSVQPSDDSAPIAGVLLSAASGNADGLILFPKDGSNVVIGSIDGPGEWGLIKASDITKAIITIENVTYELDSAQVNIQNGNTVFNVGASVFKMNTASESLYALLNDLLTGLTLLTVGTSGGPSSVPVNVTTFTGLLTRLNNLLSA